MAPIAMMARTIVRTSHQPLMPSTLTSLMMVVVMPVQAAWMASASMGILTVVGSKVGAGRRSLRA